MDSNTPGYKEAIQAVQANKPGRFHRLEYLESWYNRTQYQGRASWWTEKKIPLWERAPCIVYPIVRMAASSNVDLMLGERSFPRFVFEDDSAEKSPGKRQETDLDRALGNLHKASRWKSVCREAFEAAQKAGTVAAVYGVRNNRPFADLVPAKWCTPEFGEGFTVKRLVIQYPYIDEEEQPDGSVKAVAKLFRRVIDDQKDTVFHPAEAPGDGRQKINWRPDPSKSAAHGFGFCPVVWYPFMRGCAAVNVIDGKAIHESLTDEIQAHDIARSQWHKTALYTDPQPYEIGVSADHNPTGTTGRTAMVPTTEHGGAPHPEHNPVKGAFVDPHGSSPARMKGPGYVWRYPDPETKVGYLTTPGDALTSQKDNVADLRMKLQEALAVVFLDPENIKFAATTSGKALEAIKQKQLDRVDQYREDFRDGFLLPSLAMQLRIAKQRKIRVPMVEKLESLDPEDLDFACTVQWGSYQAPDFAEQKSIVELVQAALGGKSGQTLIDTKTAIQKLVDADVFEIEDVEAMVAEVERESEERQKRALDLAQQSKPPVVGEPASEKKEAKQ